MVIHFWRRLSAALALSFGGIEVHSDGFFEDLFKADLAGLLAILAAWERLLREHVLSPCKGWKGDPMDCLPPAHREWARCADNGCKVIE